jgi:enoyl-CoA hydratase/carnithine racemase
MIDVAHHGPIAIVTLRRAPVNAMNLEFTEEIATVFQRPGRTDRCGPWSSPARENPSAPALI